MANAKGAHLTQDQRQAIQDGLCAHRSARSIAKAVGVSPSTVTREVKTNRSIVEPKRRRGANLALRCANYPQCQVSGGACPKCSTALTACKHCRTRNCIDACPDFLRKMCPTTEKWPYICPEGCPKRGACGYPKCRYDASSAEEAYRSRLSSSREGIGLTEEQLAEMTRIVEPLVKQGHSFEAIWAIHADELPCGVRCAYNYQEKGLFGIEDLRLPRKVRMRKRRKGKEPGRERVDRAGRTYDDFSGLPLAEQARVVQLDSVVGYEHNAHDALSMHIVARAFQLYLRKAHADPAAVVAWLDHLERLFGSPEAFGAVFGLLLCDRGVEFDDWLGMERSCLKEGHRRCRVFYCDAMSSNQKAEAERNHEQLRRILPKGRSDFDRLSVYDLAACASHVNSYPLASRGGKCPFELLGDLMPRCILDELGVARIAADKVVLRPDLMAHAVAL